jgi:RimJ/RimL family protein N-acetyltransferase
MDDMPILVDVPEAIETSRLSLRIPRAGYGQEMYEAIVDGYEDYVKWLNWPKALPTPESVEEQCRIHHADFILRRDLRYVIFERETDRIVGRCALPSGLRFWSIPQFGISYFIRKSSRSQGYAAEAAHALSLMSFRMLKAKKVEIYCDVENIPSQKVPQKLGFTLECIKKGGWPRPDNLLADIQNYALFSEKPLPNWEVKW